MKTRNITSGQLYEALERVNKDFDENITMEVTRNYTSTGLPRHSVKLGVLSSYGAGGRYNPNSNRHIAAACWHVFGEFLDALGEITDDNALVVLRGESYNDPDRVVHPSDHGWVDYNIGSMYQPLYYSESCHCNGLYDK